jgi:hypothetical protein
MTNSLGIAGNRYVVLDARRLDLPASGVFRNLPKLSSAASLDFYRALFGPGIRADTEAGEGLSEGRGVRHCGELAIDAASARRDRVADLPAEDVADLGMHVPVAVGHRQSI